MFILARSSPRAGEALLTWQVVVAAACLLACRLPLQWFLAFLGLTMIGFGLAFYALFRQDRSFPDFANIWHSFASMFSYMVSEARRCCCLASGVCAEETDSVAHVLWVYTYMCVPDSEHLKLPLCSAMCLVP